MLVIGAIAGWIAEKVTQSDHSIFTNILVGIAGSFVGGVLASILNISVFGFFRTLLSDNHRAPFCFSLYGIRCLIGVELSD